MKSPRSCVAWFVVALLLGAPAFSQEVPGCGTLVNAYGPFDYRDPIARRDSLPVVEQFHFTAEVESLRTGTTGQVIGDIDYTLRAFPNHLRALRALSKYAARGGRFPATGITSADCYFQRAIAFRSDDSSVRVVYGSFLLGNRETEKAEAQFEAALSISPESIEIAYNAALFFLDVDKLERARELATMAYAGGHPLQGLRTRLAERGVRIPSPTPQ